MFETWVALMYPSLSKLNINFFPNTKLGRVMVIFYVSGILGFV